MLRNRSDQRSAREHVLKEAQRAALSSLELRAILSSTLDALREVLPVKGGSIALLNGNGELAIAAAIGTIDAEARAVRLLRGEGIAGWVVEHRAPFLSNDLDAETRVQLPTRATGSNRLIRSYLAAPLIADGEVVGVVQVDSAAPGAFAPEDQELLTGIAERLAGVVRREQVADEFFAVAAHDLRNPLTTVRGAVQILQRRLARDALEPESTAKSLENIERQLDRMAAMLATLMDLSHLQTGHLDLALEPVNLAALVSVEVKRFAATTDTRELAFTLHGIAGDPTTSDDALVLGESARLQQVVGALLSNALKFSPPATRTDVTVSADDHSVEVSVQDQGIGIPAERLPHIFRRFYSGEPARGRDLEGVGLGLFFAKGLVEAMGGTIGAASDGAGKGARVWFTLPRTAPDAW